MRRTVRVSAIFCSVLALSLSLAFVRAQEVPPATIQHDEGGVTLVRGNLTISNNNVKEFVTEPFVMLEDQAGFVDRDPNFVIPLSSQVVGRFTTDFYGQNPIQYELSLPEAPQGTLNDVDNNGQQNTGVQVYQIALENNRFGDIYLEKRDMQGWTSDYSSGKFSINPKTLYEFTGGKVLVYAPDDQQGFPSAFGADKKLFTADDPIVRLPQGFTLVDLDANPFTFDRSKEVSVDLNEQEEDVPDDFSKMSYADAFHALIEKAKKEYVFTQLKSIDWDALEAEFTPKFKEADANKDRALYLRTLRDFTWQIPDGHIGFSGPASEADADFPNATNGGLGMSLVELDDKRVLVNYLTDSGPAADAGIQLKAEIVSINGKPVEQAISDTQPFSAPFSTEHFKRLQQLRYVIRFPVDTDVKIEYKNPGETQSKTATLKAVDEQDSFGVSSFYRGFVRTAPPVEYKILDSGYGYVKVNSFNGHEKLIADTWDYFINIAKQSGVKGIIIDLRQNQGGFSSIGDRLASTFFNHDIIIRYDESYNKEIGDFFSDKLRPDRIEPPPEGERFNGPLAVLVAPGCFSACEFFAYDFTLENRAIIVGKYPTGGGGGGWFDTYLPDGVTFALPTERKLDEKGNIIIEGQGVAPTVKVPVNEETAFTDEDVILDTAVQALDEANKVDVTDGGEIAIGQTVSGEVSPKTRVSYKLGVRQGDKITIVAHGEDGLDTYLRLYTENGNQVAENDTAESTELGPDAALEDIEIPVDLTLVVEVGSLRDQSSGKFTLTVKDAAAEATPEATGESTMEASAEPTAETSMTAEAATAEPTADATLPVSEPTAEATAA
jgi:C-terminal processing protease CtpA/Prc